MIFYNINSKSASSLRNGGFSSLLLKLNTWFQSLWGKQKSILYSKEPKSKDSSELTERRSAEIFVGRYPLVDMLSEISQNLVTTCHSVESDFLSLGEKLQSIFSSANTLNQRAVDMVNTDSGQSLEMLLGDVEENTRSALSAIKSKQSKIGSELNSIFEVGEALSHLHDLCSAIKRIGKSLKMVGLNIRIESSRGDGYGATFGILADEIRDLAEKVSGVAQNMREGSEKAHTDLNAISRHMESNINELNDLIQNAEHETNNALSDVNKIIALSVRILNDCSANAGIISRMVGDIVMGIQIHDNISQRVEHIEKAFKDGIGFIKTYGEASENPEEKEQMLGKTYAILKLQSTQLEDIAADIEMVYQSSSEAFIKLKQMVEKIIVDIVPIASDGRGDHRLQFSYGVSDINSLRKALTTLLGLFGKGTDRLSLLEHARVSTSNTISHLNQYIEEVREINFDIHLKAINAIAQSIKLKGKGKTIEVIVQEMKDLSTQSNEFVTKVEGNINSVSTITHDLSNADSTSQNDMEKELSRDADDFKNKIDIFFMTSDAFSESTIDILAIGKKLSDEISGILDELNFLGKFKQRIESQNEGMKSFLLDMESTTTNLSIKAFLDDEDLTKRYTMEQERLIHQKIFDPDSAIQETAVHETDSDEVTENAGIDSEDEDLDDNIELF